MELFKNSGATVMINRNGRLVQAAIHSVRPTKGGMEDPLIALAPISASREDVARIIDRAIEIGEVVAARDGLDGAEVMLAYLDMAGIVVANKPPNLDTRYAWDEDVLPLEESDEEVQRTINGLNVTHQEKPKDLIEAQAENLTFAASSFGDAVSQFGVSSQSDPYAKKAFDLYQKDGELEFDNTTVVSISDDGGAYVLCWRWIDNDELEASDLPPLPLREARVSALESLESGDPDACILALKRVEECIHQDHKKIIEKVIDEAENGSIDHAITLLESLPEMA